MVLRYLLLKTFVRSGGWIDRQSLCFGTWRPGYRKLWNDSHGKNPPPTDYIGPGFAGIQETDREERLREQLVLVSSVFNLVWLDIRRAKRVHLTNGSLTTFLTWSVRLKNRRMPCLNRWSPGGFLVEETPTLRSQGSAYRGTTRLSDYFEV